MIDVMFGRNYTPPIAHQPATPSSYGPSPLTPQAQHRIQLWHAVARALNKRPRRWQQQQPNHDHSHPPVYEPGIVPQPAGRAPRRRGDVHVYDMPAVQADRARV